MTNVCICGGGNLGHVTAGFLAAQPDVSVNLLTRRPGEWDSCLQIDTPDGTRMQGMLRCISDRPEEVVAQADIVLLCLPGFSIASVMKEIAPHLQPSTAVGTVVSSTGFFLEAENNLPPNQPLFGFQRVPFIARTTVYGHRASLLGYKSELAVAMDHVDNQEQLRQTIQTLFHTPVRLLHSHYEVSLSNSNPLLHPARLHDLWKDWHPGIFYQEVPLFYEQWTTEAAASYIQMDRELQALLRKLKVEEGCMPDVLTYYESHDAASLAEKLRSIEAFKGIKAPMKLTTGGYMPDLDSRYFTEDIPYGLATIRRMCHENGIECPTIDHIYLWAENLLQHRRMQQRMLDILVEVDRICRQNNIPYWLSSGTLIGALRHDGFIPWDDDLDIEMMRKDYLRLLPLLKTQLPDWLVVQDNDSDPNYCFFYAKVRDTRSIISEGNGYDEAFRYRGIYIDIFPLERQHISLHRLSEFAFGHAYKWWKRGQLSRVRMLYKVNHYAVHPLLRLLNGLTRPTVITSGLGIPFHNPRYERDIFPLTSHTFEGHSFCIPHDADHLLRGIYGDYMQLPDLSRLQPHQGIPPYFLPTPDKPLDVAVLMLFFNRPETLQKVFNEVRKARPARLFLYQDGPRNDADMQAIETCRQIVSDEHIDWPCDVHRNYQPHNQGCDPSGYLAQRWAFSLADRCIVLEDDVVPSQSFFPYCQELLDRYADNPKVWMIAGFNAEESSIGRQPSQAAQQPYFFTSVFSIWGWASWRRVVEQWDPTYAFLDDPEAIKKIQGLIDNGTLRRDFLDMSRRHRDSGRAHFETIFWSSMILNDALAAMPARNLINNVGAEGVSTHYNGSLLTMPRRLRSMFTMPRYELRFPLTHPTDVVEEPAFRERIYLLNAWNHPWRKIQYSIEELLLNLRYGNFSRIAEALNRRIAKYRRR